MYAVAVIVAGGSGSRMGADIPKQFLSLAGKPVLQHTIARFAESHCFRQCVLVLPAEQIEHATQVCQLQPQIDSGWLTVTAGGGSRTESVSNGLRLARQLSDGQEDTVVSVHDGVRPFVTTAMLTNSRDAAHQTGSGVCAVPVKSSMREQVPGGSSRAVDRANFFHVQTPQSFRLSPLLEAYAQLSSDAVVSDDATVFEMAGNSVTLVEGSYDNLKLTTPEDMLIGEQIVKRTAQT